MNNNINSSLTHASLNCKYHIEFPLHQNTAKIKECMANQLKRDKESDQLSLYDPKYIKCLIYFQEILKGKPLFSGILES